MSWDQHHCSGEGISGLANHDYASVYIENRSKAATKIQLDTRLLRTVSAPEITACGSCWLVLVATLPCSGLLCNEGTLIGRNFITAGRDRSRRPRAGRASARSIVLS